MGSLPESQELVLDSDEDFGVEAMDYLTRTGVKVASQRVAETGKSIKIPIQESSLNEIQRIGPWLSGYDQSAEVLLRLGLSKGGRQRQYTIPTVMKPKLHNNKWYRWLTG